MNILVSGGAGFVGSHLCEKLLRHKHDVTVVDNSTANINRNLKEIKKQLTIYKYDVRDKEAFNDLGAIRKFDCIIHLAALADIVPSIENPELYHDVNVNGTINVLEFARKQKVKKFIYAASGSCYGDRPKVPTGENHPINPCYPYALTKNIGEQYALHYHRIYGLPTTSLRFFNIYGPRSRTTGAYGAVFGVFIAQKLAGKPYTLVGDGNQARDFLYVTDAVDSIVKAIGKGKSGEVYNIGSGSCSTIRNIVNLLGSSNGTIHVPRRPGEPTATQAHIAKAMKDLDWGPAVPLPDGIKLLLNDTSYWEKAPVWTKEKITKATEKWFKYVKDTPNANQL